MQTIKVPIKFEGVVEVKVFTKFDPEQAKELAKLASLARVMVAVMNDEQGDELDEYQDKYNLSDYSATYDWSNTKVEGVCGHWTINE